MKKVFVKNIFPIAPGGNIYHWQEATTNFEVPDASNYVIAITASANNSKQNNSTDDDDLRVIIDDFEFCTKEIHQEKISWKGFGTTAAWDGASLKGSEKTIYFFLELSDEFTHKIQFKADENPILKEIKIWKIEDLKFSLSNLIPSKKQLKAIHEQLYRGIIELCIDSKSTKSISRLVNKKIYEIFENSLKKEDKTDHLHERIRMFVNEVSTLEDTVFDFKQTHDRYRKTNSQLRAKLKAAEQEIAQMKGVN